MIIYHLSVRTPKRSRGRMFSQSRTLYMLLISVLLGMSQATASDTSPASEIDSYIQNSMTRYGLTGAAISILKNGEPIFKKGYGLASIELNVPVRTDTVFQISSISKLFTNVAIYQLIDAGEMSFDAEIGNYVQGLPEDWSRLSIKRLMSHTSGLPDYVAVYPPWPTTAQDALNAIAETPFDFETGAGSQYNQTNYLLLMQAIENVTKKKFIQVINDTIFTPLNLETAAYGAKYAVIPGRATSYRPKRGGGLELRRDFDWPDYMFSAAGANISLNDFEQWAISLLDGDIASQSTLNLAWSPVTLNSGERARHSLGWEYNENDKFISVGHDGARMVDFRHFISKQTGETVTVILLTNGAHSFFNPQNIAEGLGDIIAEGIQNLDEKLVDGLYSLLSQGDELNAKGLYQSFKSSAAAADYNTENALNGLGYTFLGQGKNREAILVFELNVESYPTSANAYDSLGEAYLAAGQISKAKRAYESALEFDPSNENAKVILKTL